MSPSIHDKSGFNSVLRCLFVSDCYFTSVPYCWQFLVIVHSGHHRDLTLLFPASLSLHTISLFNLLPLISLHFPLLIFSSIKNVFFNFQFSFDQAADMLDDEDIWSDSSSLCGNLTKGSPPTFSTPGSTTTRRSSCFWIGLKASTLVYVTIAGCIAKCFQIPSASWSTIYLGNDDSFDSPFSELRGYHRRP